MSTMQPYEASITDPALSIIFYSQASNPVLDFILLSVSAGTRNGVKKESVGNKCSPKSL